MTKKTRRELTTAQQQVLTNARNVVRVMTMLEGMDENCLRQVRSATDEKLKTLAVPPPPPNEEP